MQETEAQEINDLAKDLEALQKVEMFKVKGQKDEDDQLLEGLNDLNKQEKDELDNKRKNFTPRQEPAKSVEPPSQPKQEEAKQEWQAPAPSHQPQQARPKEEEESGDGGWTKTVVIGAALAIAAFMIAKKVVTK